ncbi:unnamed protein product [Ilex paraguariensis]|uniref:PB1 domain-containing protein n=1 Tax=Ilex paraguariensis TaxID=185542 RepID=A0ABC8R1V6_9AQUA
MTRALNNKTNTIKFLYSYGGKIVPRKVDGKLRYVGGFTRVVAVDRSITFTELIVKFGELCGSSTSLRCKLPSEDLDVLVSITSDEDLFNVIEVYDRVSFDEKSEMKIRAVLFPIKPLKTISLPPSPVLSISSTSSASKSPPCVTSRVHSLPQQYRCGSRSSSPAIGFAVDGQKSSRMAQRCYYRCYDCQQGRSRHAYLVPQWSHCH